MPPPDTTFDFSVTDGNGESLDGTMTCEIHVPPQAQNLRVRVNKDGSDLLITLTATAGSAAVDADTYTIRDLPVSGGHLEGTFFFFFFFFVEVLLNPFSVFGSPRFIMPKAATDSFREGKPYLFFDF